MVRSLRDGWNLRPTTGELAAYCAATALAGYLAGMFTAMMLDRHR